MRTLAFSILMITAFTAFASGPGSDGTTPDPEQAQLIQQIVSKIDDGQVADQLGLTGEANITFSIDQNETVHVENVEASDFLTEFHIRQTLEGLKMEVSDSLVGKAFSTIVNFVHSN